MTFSSFRNLFSEELLEGNSYEDSSNELSTLLDNKKKLEGELKREIDELESKVTSIKEIWRLDGSKRKSDGSKKLIAILKDINRLVESKLKKIKNV